MTEEGKRMSVPFTLHVGPVALFVVVCLFFRPREKNSGYLIIL